MLKNWFSPLAILLFSQTLPAQHPNILIGTDNAPNEPSICVNPKNTNELVAGANIDNLYYSHDGGATWSPAPVTCPWGIWGDPVIGVDTAGAFYFLHLSNPAGGNWIDRIIIQKSTDAGTSWSAGAYTGLNGTKAQDKHWIAVDPQTNALNVTWTQFDQYGSNDPADSSIILFSKSTDGGLNWTAAKRINQLSGDCIDSDNTAEGAVPCVGPNGEIFVAWSNRDKIWFDRSTDGGQTWLTEDIFVSDQPGGWDYAIPGIYRANGLPVTACDLSGGPQHGTIYINWTDQRNGADDTDVWLAKSTDGGLHWSPPVRVNDDNTGRQQFFTWMAIDQATGYLWFVFYDRRNYNDARTDVFMAVSKDGGATFQNFKVSESPFIPNENVFFGDYTNVTAHNNVVRPIWTRLVGNDLSVWTALVDPDLVTSAPWQADNPLISLDAPYPNPFSDGTAVSFKLHGRALVSLALYDLRGRKVATLIDDQWMDYGKHIEKIDADRLHLAPGTYIAVLTVDGRVLKQKMLKM
ncbi:MAG TPA: T9SS type A sorting domain-containing protein [Saprospiraceae bacterium]|nr:T9SS type A sorting domain-containing protein [Saprospiraceae bacterium]